MLDFRLVHSILGSLVSFGGNNFKRHFSPQFVGANVLRLKIIFAVIFGHSTIVSITCNFVGCCSCYITELQVCLSSADKPSNDKPKKSATKNSSQLRSQIKVSNNQSCRIVLLQ